MTSEEAPAAPAKLTFGATISAAHQSVFGRFRRFAKIALIPFLLTLAFTAIEVPLSEAAPIVELVFVVLDLLPYALLGIALNRVVLLQEEPGFLPPRPLGRRTWAYLGYTLLMIVIAGVPLVILIIGLFGFTYTSGNSSGTIGGFGQNASPGWLVLGALAASLALLYLLARLSLVFPALSVDQKLGLAGSWRLTRGSGLRLVGLMLAILAFTLLAGIVGSVVLGADINISIGGGIEVPPGLSLLDVLLAEAPALLWSALVGIAGFGLTTGVYASAYAQLTGWGAPRQDILERFE